MSRTSAADGGAKLATDATAAASGSADDADDEDDDDDDDDVDAADAEVPGVEITAGNADDDEKEATAALLGEFASNVRLSVNAIMFACEPPLRLACRLAHQRPNANNCSAATAAGSASSQPIAWENNLLTCTAFWPNCCCD